MDSRAKQRLTGAVILVALFVLLVPELLTGPRGADTPGTPAEEGMRRYTIDLNAANPSSAPVESQASVPPVALPQPASEDDLAKPGEEAAPAVSQPAPAAASAPLVTAPVVAPVEAPVAAAATPAVRGGSPTTSPAPRLEVPKPEAVIQAEKGTFAVQLGSFESRENADRLVRDMTAKGFTAFLAPIKSGSRMLYRVRVGPTRDRPQAEALAAQLRRIGQSGSIVPIS